MKMDIYQKLEKKLGIGRIKRDESLVSHTTFKIGGPADFYYEAGTVGELVNGVEVAKDFGIPYFILGGGSNILVADKGFRGLVIKNKHSFSSNKSKNIKILGYRGEVKSQKSKERDRAFGERSLLSQCEIKNVLVEADSGVPFNQLVRFTIEEGFDGLEEFLGLPGTVGGAVVCNAHWQDKKIQDLIVSKKVFGKEILLSAIFGLKKGCEKILWERAQRALEYRQKTQPLAFSSAGCIFKNIKKSEAVRIGTADFTTSAGFLVEAAGLKGARVGGVQISPLHANFIINLGGGKAADVLRLISLVKRQVLAKFGVGLQEEIVRVGEF